MTTLEAVKAIIAKHLVDLYPLFDSFNLPLSKLTLIARDPNDDEMRICVTNESDQGLAKAFELAMRREGVDKT